MGSHRATSLAFATLCSFGPYGPTNKTLYFYEADVVEHNALYSDINIDKLGWGSDATSEEEKGRSQRF